MKYNKRFFYFYVDSDCTLKIESKFKHKFSTRERELVRQMIKRLLSNNFAVMRYMPNYTRLCESDVKVKKVRIATLSYFSLNFLVWNYTGIS